MVGILSPVLCTNFSPGGIGQLLSSHTSSELVVIEDLNLDWLSVSFTRLRGLCLELDLTLLNKLPTRPNFKNLSKSTLIELVHHSNTLTVGSLLVLEWSKVLKQRGVSSRSEI